MAEQVIVAAAIVRGGRLLAQQRAYPAEAMGRWELPGGTAEIAETDAQAVARECVEELGVDVVVGDRIAADVALPHGRCLRTFAATPADPHVEPRPLQHTAVRWLDVDELAELDWLPADRILVPALRALLSGADQP